MPFVVDASIVGAWILPDEDDPAANTLLRTLAVDTALAPVLLKHEFANLLVKAIRRNRVADREAPELIRRLEALPIAAVASGDLGRVLSFALRHGLTAYDASYLALAVDQRLPLATSDEALRRAATAEGIPVLPERR